MRKLPNKPYPKWWKEKPAYELYHFREYSGILIAIWGFYWVGFIIATFIGQIILTSLPDIDPFFRYLLFLPLKYYFLFTAIGLAGAIIHAITWFGVMPNVMPYPISNTQKQVFFFLLIGLWISVSILLYMLILSLL